MTIMGSSKRCYYPLTASDLALSSWPEMEKRQPPDRSDSTEASAEKPLTKVKSGGGESYGQI